MIRIFKVKPDHDNIRVDRWFKINISKIPQSLNSEIFTFRQN